MFVLPVLAFVFPSLLTGTVFPGEFDGRELGWVVVAVAVAAVEPACRALATPCSHLLLVVVLLLQLHRRFGSGGYGSRRVVSGPRRPASQTDVAAGTGDGCFGGRARANDRGHDEMERGQRRLAWRGALEG